VKKKKVSYMFFLPYYSWIEHDPYDLLDSVIRCADEAVRKFGMMGHDISDLKGINADIKKKKWYDYLKKKDFFFSCGYL
jgi:glycerol kinase